MVAIAEKPTADRKALATPDARPDRPGWQTLPAGPERRLRVNCMWVVYGSKTGGEDKPFLIVEAGKPDIQAAEVEVLGAARTDAMEDVIDDDGCSRNHASVVTIAAISYRA